MPRAWPFASNPSTKSLLIAHIVCPIPTAVRGCVTPCSLALCLQSCNQIPPRCSNSLPIPTAVRSCGTPDYMAPEIILNQVCTRRPATDHPSTRACRAQMKHFRVLTKMKHFRGPTRDMPAARRRVSNSGAGRCHEGNATACSPESPLPTPRR
eukprot:363924-Chlamydomonas_euryale.AAC.3